MQPALRTAAFAIASALSLSACETMMDTPPANPQAVVDERVAIMKKFGMALGATGKYTQDKATIAEAKTAVAAARAKVSRVHDLFPRGTALGDKGVVQSRALSKIFANRSDFDDRLDNLSRALAALDGSLTPNGKPQTATTLNAVKGACKSCHDAYRAAEE